MPSLVKWAVESLGCLKSEETVPALIALLKDEQSAIRWVAVVTLARLGRDSAAAAAALRESLADSDGEVRAAATWALSRVQAPATGGTP